MLKKIVMTLTLALSATVGGSAPAAAQTPFAMLADNATYCVQGAYSGSSLQVCTLSSNQFTRAYVRARNAWVIRTGNGCLDGYKGHGQPVVVVQCDNSKDQDWWVNSYGQVQNHANQLCIDIAGGRMASGSSVIMWNCHGGANQRFLLSNLRPASALGGVRLPPVAHSIAQQVRINGNGIISTGGGNIISTGGGNIIAAGGGNIIAAGGGN